MLANPGLKRRIPAIIGSAIVFVIASGAVAAYVPWHLTQWHFEPALFPIARVMGGILVAAGYQSRSDFTIGEVVASAATS